MDSNRPDQPSAGAMRAADTINCEWLPQPPKGSSWEKLRETRVEKAAVIIDRETHAKELAEALRMLLSTYVGLVNSGDAGHWNPENDVDVKNARAALAKYQGGHDAE